MSRSPSTEDYEYLPRELTKEFGIPAEVLLATGPPYELNTCKAAVLLYWTAREVPSFLQPLDWDQVDVQRLRDAIERRRAVGEPPELLDRELEHWADRFCPPPAPAPGWEGTVPSEAIADAQGLLQWLEGNKSNMLYMRDSPLRYQAGAAFDTGRVALRNARRLLDHLGLSDYPECDTESLPNGHAAEQAIAKLEHWLRALIGDVRCHDEATPQPTKAPKAKRSTEKNEALTKMIAALTKHHNYANGHCLNLEPIGNNQLAKLADVDKATASAFFQKQFKGHGNYKIACATPAILIAALKLLNREFLPQDLYGNAPPGESVRDE